ncbi:hypothetical protein [Dapis sp. BLCC M229]|uniref:hypothetical protein n=1 Tax=Dapis sp. BLCC M229 TaxID=3400188 RepID=UPI003CEB0476
MSQRLEIWSKLPTMWKPQHFSELASTISLTELPQKIQSILQRQIQGRVLVKVSSS